MRETREEPSRETTEGGEKTGVEGEREIKKIVERGSWKEECMLSVLVHLIDGIENLFSPPPDIPSLSAPSPLYSSSSS